MWSWRTESAGTTGMTGDPFIADALLPLFAQRASKRPAVDAIRRPAGPDFVNNWSNIMARVAVARSHPYNFRR